MAEKETVEDFIEVIVPELDNGAFLVALAGGVVVGIVAVYAFLEWQKNHPQTPVPMEVPEGMQLTMLPTEEAEAPTGEGWPGQ